MSPDAGDDAAAAEVEPLAVSAALEADLSVGRPAHEISLQITEGIELEDRVIPINTVSAIGVTLENVVQPIVATQPTPQDTGSDAAGGNTGGAGSAARQDRMMGTVVLGRNVDTVHGACDLVPGALVVQGFLWALPARNPFMPLMM